MTVTFSCTSDAPYDRHKYKIKVKNGKEIICDSYDEVQYVWFSYKDIPDYLDIVEVLDKPKVKEKVKTKGFGQ